ncbi:MAG: hypothetical protein LBL82_00885 [Oscillospiraceae bacterium]|jgi:preprotein translocase subunit YajC|nr:hypothetical protein [Oscillospiraceae bacterium]
MGKLIALSGVFDSGKTSALLKVIDKLVSSGGKEKILYESVPRNHNKLQDKPRNKTSIITINGIIIVVVTFGDDKVYIQNQFERVEKEVEKENITADVIICASRSEGYTYTLVEEIAKQKGMEFIRINKTRHETKTEQEKDNSDIADKIVKLAGF